MSRRRWSRVAGACLAVLVLCALDAPVSGQSPRPAADQGQAVLSNPAEPDVPEKAGKVLRAFRITGTSPQIDGRLDEEVWAVADAIDDFVQDEPDDQARPTERTVVQVAYDDRFLYVAVRCDEAGPSQITTGLGRRDNQLPSDRVSLNIDPRHDHLTAYTFSTNPSRVQRDFTFFDDFRRNNDYDGVWEVRTQVTDEGWTAEFRIPFSQMRFDLAPGRRGGVGVPSGAHHLSPR